MPSNFTTRRLKSASGTDIRGINGAYIRVKIQKETRAVRRVKPSNWTEDAIAAYNHFYPNDVAVRTRRAVSRSVEVIEPAVVEEPAVLVLPATFNIEPAVVEEPVVLEEPVVVGEPAVVEVKPAVVEVESAGAGEKSTSTAVEEVKEDCCICCSELPKATTTLECGHTFCTGCILTWFKQKNNCPMCRAVVEEAPSVNIAGRVHISSWHANDLINLTNQILNGRNMGLMSAHTNTRVGFEDIHERYRTGMLRRSSRATGGNGHRFAQAMVEVTNRLAANIPEDGYNSYFTSENR